MGCTLGDLCICLSCAQPNCLLKHIHICKYAYRWRLFSFSSFWSNYSMKQKMWNMYNRMKLPYFGLNVRLLFTDLFRIRIRIRFRIRNRIRIRNVYFGSGSDLDLAKSFGSFRIRIRNTARKDWSLKSMAYKRTWPNVKYDRVSMS